MEYKCEISKKAAQPILSVRQRTPVQNLPQVLGEVYGKIAAYLCELGANPIGAPFAAYYNMDMQDLDVEIGFPVTHALPSKDEIQASEIPAGNYATCLYSGPYQDIGPAYEALTKFIQENNAQPSGVAYEYYLNDPTETPPQELRTQIVFPLLAA